MIALVDWTSTFVQLGQDLRHLGPELWLIGTACLLLLLDLVLSEEDSGTLLPWPALLLGILGAFVMVYLQFNGKEAPHSVFFGTVAVDRFASFFKLIVLAGTAISIVLAHELRAFQGKRMGEFYALLFAAVAGMFFMVGATDLVVAFLAIELVSIPSFALVAYVRQDRQGTEASIKYVLYSAFSSGVMLYGLSILYALVGSTRFSAFTQLLDKTEVGRITAAVAMLLAFGGFAFKMGAAPFHFWAPDVYQGAPTAVTAWLSVTSKAAGVALFTRFVLAFGGEHAVRPAIAGFDWGTAIAVVSALTMTIGNLGGLYQTSLKRLLAYSSVAHVGYVLMGLAAMRAARPDTLEVPEGTVLLSAQGGGGGSAMAFYLLAYLFMNLGAFAVVIAISNRTGSDDLSTFRGIGRRSPFLAGCLALFLFSLIGLPPTAGFTGKLQLFMAAIDAKLFGLVVIAGVNTAISVYYYMKVLKVVYLETGEGPEAREPLLASTGLTIACFALAIPVVWLGLGFDRLAVSTQKLEVLIRAAG